jgi:hypothetical protein
MKKRSPVPWLPAVLGAVLGSWGCLDTGGELGQQCVINSDCTDETPCTFDTCSVDGLCEHAPVSDGTLADQVAGDCAVSQCVGGVTASVYDDTDVSDDHNPCTADLCTPSGPAWVPVADGVECEDGHGSVGACSDGTCVLI